MSYAWGNPQHDRLVHRLAADLQNADYDVVFDQWHNTSIGASIARFVERASATDFIIVVCTPRYLEKYERNSEVYKGSVLAGEMELVNQRLIGTEIQKRNVLPVLLEGSPETALPPLMRGRIYADIRKETHYCVALFDLILTIGGVGFDEPGILEIREAQKAAAAKLERLGTEPGSPAVVLA